MVVGVERTVERRVFVVAVDTRDSDTLQKVIHDHVRSGSIIYTDRWKGYSWIYERPYYEHETVNHSVTFKDEITGVHTNTVEGTNSGLKRMIPERGRVKEGIENRLAEFIWRRKCEGSDTWECLLDAFREVKYV